MFPHAKLLISRKYFTFYILSGIEIHKIGHTKNENHNGVKYICWALASIKAHFSVCHWREELQVIAFNLTRLRVQIIQCHHLFNNLEFTKEIITNNKKSFQRRNWLFVKVVLLFNFLVYRQIKKSIKAPIRTLIYKQLWWVFKRSKNSHYPLNYINGPPMLTILISRCLQHTNSN